MNRTALLYQTRTAVRIVLYTALGTGAVLASGFAGAHIYLESQDSTPSSWPRHLRFAYRAAVFNSRYLEQNDAAHSELTSALDKIEADALENDTPPPRYSKALILLAQIERTQGHLQDARRHLLAALEDKSDLTPTLISLATRQVGEIQERQGDVRAAQSSFDAAIAALLPSHVAGSIPRLDGSVKYTAELVDAIKALALLRARQGKLQESLAGLLSVLQYQRQHPSVTSSSCATAATMANVAELVWALGDEGECRRWNTEALAICTKGRNEPQKYCLECAGISHNMLGLLSRRQGDKDAAQGHFMRALICAERADDRNGIAEYASNLNLVQS